MVYEVNQLVSTSQPSNTPVSSMHILVNEAIDRLAALTKITGTTVSRLRSIPQGKLDQQKGNSVSEPTLEDKLTAVHQIITVLENDAHFISSSVG